MTALYRSFALALAIFAATTPASMSQDASGFVKPFSGEWFVFDPQYGPGDATCAIGLSTEVRDTDARRDAASKQCVEPLSTLAAWDIDGGQLRLFADGAQTPMAILGGNQRRITGALTASNRGLIVERAQGDASTRAIAQAVGRHRCIYRGFTQDCAAPADLDRPAMTAEGGAYASVGVLVDLNVRDEPRADAPIVGLLPRESCLKVNYCTTASDGIWCRARFGESSGWVHKVALRKDEWPVLTYANSCPSGE